MAGIFISFSYFTSTIDSSMSVRDAFLGWTLELARVWDARAADFDALDAEQRWLGLALAGAGSALGAGLLLSVSLRTSTLVLNGVATPTNSRGCNSEVVEDESKTIKLDELGVRSKVSRKKRSPGSASGSRSMVPSVVVVPNNGAPGRGEEDEEGHTKDDHCDGSIVSTPGASPDTSGEGNTDVEGDLPYSEPAIDSTTKGQEHETVIAPYPPKSPAGLPVYEEEGHLGTYYIAGDLAAAPSASFAQHRLEARRNLSPAQCLEGLRKHLTPHGGAVNTPSASLLGSPVPDATFTTPSTHANRPHQDSFSLPDFKDEVEEAAVAESQDTNEEVPGSSSTTLRKDLLRRGERILAIEFHPSQQKHQQISRTSLNFRTPGFARARTKVSEGPGGDRLQSLPHAAMTTGKLPPRRSAMNRDVALPSPSRNPLRSMDASPQSDVGRMYEMHTGRNAPSPSGSMFVAVGPASPGIRSPCPSPALPRARLRRAKGSANLSHATDFNEDNKKDVPISPSPAVPSPRSKYKPGRRRQGSILGPTRRSGNSSEPPIGSLRLASTEQVSDSVVRRIQVQMPDSPVQTTSADRKIAQSSAYLPENGNTPKGSRAFSRSSAAAATPSRHLRLQGVHSTPAPHLPSSPAPQSKAVSRTLSYTPGRLPVTTLPAQEQ